jgi:hypothetical protein
MLVEVGILCVVLARTPEKCGVGESVFCSSSSDVVLFTATGHQPQVSSSTDLETVLARDLSFVKEIRHVLVERADHNFLVWIALDNPIAEVRERVFRKQLDLIEGFPEVDFDFNVIAINGRDPYTFASGAKIVYSRKDDELAD